MKKTVQIDIIAGFLGAGKTTLINKLLKEAYFDEKIAVLENEFGSVGVDGSLIQRDGITVTEMTGGCICCSLKTTLTAGLIEICETFSPDRVIIEPTGLADVSDIAGPVADAGRKYPMEIGRVITVINGANFSEQLEYGEQIVRNQLNHTDLAIVSRIEKTDKKEIIRKAHEVREDLTILTADWSKINGLTILDLADRIGDHHPAENHGEGCTCGCHNGDHHHHHHHSAEEYSSSSGETDRVFSENAVRALGETLSSGTGGRVYRAKGLLPGEETGWRFDYVGGEFRWEPIPCPALGKYVFIGKEIDADFWQNQMK
ncbi:MAG: CobW family GTP-binding protein [Clostridia bacterium]